MASIRGSYQEGSIICAPRVKGSDKWVYRWRESKPDGTVLRRSKIIGDLTRYPTKADAKRLVENLRSEVNATSAVARIVSMSVAEAWGHFQANELRDPDINRSPTTIVSYLTDFKLYIIPKWGSESLDDVKSIAVEKWLRELMTVSARFLEVAPETSRLNMPKVKARWNLAPKSKASIRNHMSALFSHCIRHELYGKPNPMRSVLQSAATQRKTDVLTLDEMVLILGNIEAPAIKIMAATAAASALRRSEFRGLKWEDVDLENCWFHCKRGLVQKYITRMKTPASRKSVEMNSTLAQALSTWRGLTPYPQDADWVFASPYTAGERPYWPDTALKGQVRPAAIAAGITKTIGWHTFRHSFATLLGDEGEDLKVIQELLRHASPVITASIYLHGNSVKKRSALRRVSGVFVADAKASQS